MGIVKHGLHVQCNKVVVVVVVVAGGGRPWVVVIRLDRDVTVRVMSCYRLLRVFYDTNARHPVGLVLPSFQLYIIGHKDSHQELSFFLFS